MCIRLIPALFLFLLSACTPEPTTGPGEIRWDRETCVRCNMAISDHYFSAQVRSAVGKGGLYKFDDLGCAVIWLEKQDWKDGEGTEIWVTDFRNGQWIDARNAFYVKDKITPMNYGLGAQSEPAAGAISFTQAVEHIRQSEKDRRQHGGHMHMQP